MTVRGPGPVARNDGTAMFFDGTGRGEFLLLRCLAGGHWNRPQAHACDECGSTDLAPRAASGRARLVSWVVVHGRPREDGTAPDPPALPAIVEFEEGPWWWTQIVGAEPSELRDGLPLQVVFERPEGSEAVPVFTPA